MHPDRTRKPVPRAHRHAAWLLLGIAAIHTLMTFVLFGEGVAEIAAAGVGGGAHWSFEAMNAFWFVLFGGPLALLALALLHPGDPRLGRWLALGLGLGTLAAGAVLPLSGLWALLLPVWVLARGEAGAAAGESA